MLIQFTNINMYGLKVPEFPNQQGSNVMRQRGKSSTAEVQQLIFFPPHSFNKL